MKETETGNVTAREIMHEGCTCIPASASVTHACKLMAEGGFGALPICSAEDRLVGMLTDRDVVVKCVAAGKDPGTCTAGELAEGPVLWIRDSARADEVLSIMEEHQIRRLPVIDQNKKLVGIIAQSDVARHLGDMAAGELVRRVSSGPAVQHAV